MRVRARLNKYSRRISSGGRRRGKVFIIIAAVIAFILLSVLISVAVGLALGERAEEHDGTLPPLNISVGEHYSGNKTVKAVDARTYEWGYGIGYYLSDGITDFSVCLRDGDGFITYHSDVDVVFGGESDMGSRKLSDAVELVSTDGGYLCGYFYSTAFSEENEYLRNIKKEYEIALIHEAAEGGVDDILIVGLEPDAENIAEIEEYVSRAAYAAEDSVLGVLVGADCVKNALDRKDGIAPRISAVCDFIAIDLRHVSSSEGAVDAGTNRPIFYDTLDDLKYYVKVYSARLVFSSENSKLCDSARKWGVTNLQIIE